MYYGKIVRRAVSLCLLLDKTWWAIYYTKYTTENVTYCVTGQPYDFLWPSVMIYHDVVYLICYRNKAESQMLQNDLEEAKAQLSHQIR